ncbi:MAG TPA: hypothetical protein VKX45_09890 [Bryobacteraceae bacterium]|jgi:hypothetical protein|nr:hypothetical protein [Bryobacteraceae bacterium]
MVRLLWRLTRGYRLRPWRSPYLRWRIETYQGLHAEAITFRQFWSFVWRERRNLLRYLRWGAENARYQPATTPPPFA